MFRAVFSANTPTAIVLGVIAAVASVIAFFYYAGVVRRMWFHEPLPEYAGTGTPQQIPAALTVAIGLTAVGGRGHRRLPAVLRPDRRARLHLTTRRSLRGGIPASLTLAPGEQLARTGRSAPRPDSSPHHRRVACH